ncbi:FAD-binding oxidoreductase [Micromonospora sp. NBC_01796]|uniref:FAD-binding oxidoreductase n=1 Tax=Micromonospora sp. NBC_01796 TaxID=2975987 RepID=UPI002DD99BF6|nr:FAD-binding protein [Micromonospora sp. NBC_01796]WSA86820.1 FAD-binding protein [Micromonospora sp. NBC_01796]
MGDHTRRSLLRRTAVAAAAGVAVHQGLAASPASGAPGPAWPPPFGPIRVTPDDPRYQDLVQRRYNLRFEGTPEQIRVVGTTDHVVRAVQEAVRAGKRVAVRSGGHCFENFVDDPAVRVVIDMSGMTGVYFDPKHNAFAVEAGATLGEVYRRLFLGWGVTIPGGYCPEVGAGGHVQGGGYGPLCRLLGLVVDYLYAVEVVVVDRDGTARSVVATREPSDPNRELWWAHTGGGGGNFGVVTRYWFRTPGARGTDPTRLLPQPPASVLTFEMEWSWEGLGPDAFARLVGNHGRWFERHSGPGTPYAGLYSELLLFRRQSGRILMLGQVAGANAERLLDEHVAALSAGFAPPSARTQQRLPWLASALRGPGEDPGRWRLKTKAGYLRRRLTDRQVDVVHRHLTRDDYDIVGGTLSLNSYGGQINAVAPDATAAAQRDSILKLFYLVAWADPKDEARHLRWIREFYRDMYADTGGVPVPGPVNDGSFVNYPDTDLADPGWNTSGVPWHALYYKENYPRLRRVKARWDPRDVFHHTLSVRP